MVMKTKDFCNDAEVEMLVQAFENRTISAAEFSHDAHIAVALSYLATWPSQDALDRMRKNVRAFAAHHGAANHYHETLTIFWMRLLDHVASSSPQALPLWRRINVIVEQWGSRRPVQSHYSDELIRSQQAREKWMPPDRLPLPF